MGEHAFRDERLAQLDELRPGSCCHPCGLIRVRGRVIGPALFGDLVGVDEGAARQQRRQREFDERRFASTIGSDDEIEPLHRVGVAFTFLRRGGRRFTVSTTEVPSGRCSTISPSSLRATVVIPRSPSSFPYFDSASFSWTAAAISALNTTPSSTLSSRNSRSPASADSPRRRAAVC